MRCVAVACVRACCVLRCRHVCLLFVRRREAQPVSLLISAEGSSSGLRRSLGATFVQKATCDILSENALSDLLALKPYLDSFSPRERLLFVAFGASSYH